MKHLLLILILFTSSIGISQHEFSVLASKGYNITVKQGTTWKSLSTGTKLYKGNTIKLHSGNYVGLLHKSGKTIELKVSGEFTIADLESRISSSETSFAKKYAKFALNLDKEDYSQYNYNVTGSVERAIVDANMILLKQKTVIIPELPFSVMWHPASDQDIQLKVISLFSETLYVTKPSTEYATVDLIGFDFSVDTLIILNIYEPDFNIKLNDKGVVCSIMPKVLSDTIVSDYKKLTAELDITKAVNHLVLASYFKEKGLDLYALSHLLQARLLEPEVETYEYAYNEYLVTLGILTKE